MKIKCITSSTKDVPLEILSNYTGLNSSIPLILDKEYTVYALGEYYQSIWYCICDESYIYHPMWIPFPFFQLTDNRISRYWLFSFKKDVKKDRFFLGFQEWADRDDFYSNLVDGEEREVEIFQNYKNLMDMEFPNSSITGSAQIGDDNWLMCPDCIDAWECNNILDALVRCPTCLKVFNNPRYKNAWPTAE